MSPQARERSFDELARELASGSISRGKALWLMAAALVGSALASTLVMLWPRTHASKGRPSAETEMREPAAKRAQLWELTVHQKCASSG